MSKPLNWELSWRTNRFTAGYSHALKPLTYQALFPFIAGFATDAIFLAQLAEVGCDEGFDGEFFSLVHFEVFFPRHDSVIEFTDDYA